MLVILPRRLRWYRLDHDDIEMYRCYQEERISTSRKRTKRNTSVAQMQQADTCALCFALLSMLTLVLCYSCSLSGRSVSRVHFHEIGSPGTSSADRRISKYRTSKASHLIHICMSMCLIFLFLVLSFRLVVFVALSLIVLRCRSSVLLILNY